MKHILEIGCGQGFNTYFLSRNTNNSVIGVDLSRKDISIAKLRYPRVDFRVMDVSKIRFNNETFDEIQAIDILEHVDNLEKVITECFRVLKRGGKFVINVPSERSKKWLQKLRSSYFKEIHHVRVFNNAKNEVELLLKKNGFKLFLKKPIGFLQHIELYMLFTRTKKSNSQLGIGNWRDTKLSFLIHIGLLYLDPFVFSLPLKYIPIWIVTLPVGMLISYFGNKVFPKSFYYEFYKIDK